MTPIKQEILTIIKQWHVQQQGTIQRSDVRSHAKSTWEVQRPHKQNPEI